MREAYRKNKGIIYPVLEQKKLNCSLIILYFHTEILNYPIIETNLVKVLRQLVLALEKGTGDPVYQPD